MPHRLLLAAGLLAVLSSATIVAGVSSAQDFRVETDIFVGEEKDPFTTTLTLFADGLVYDFLLTESGEITIFDPRMQHFTLLEPRQKLKTVITMQEVLENCISLNMHAEQSKDSFFTFAAQPKFNVTEEATKDQGQDAVRLTLESGKMTYVAVGRRPEMVAAAPMYRSFADAFVRLNALRPGGTLPAPRIALNEQLGDRGLLPVEVKRIILPQGRFQKKLEIRMHHLVNWKLSKTDRDKIEEAGGHRINFTSIPFEKYRELDREAMAVKQAKR
jgi:hypothetical protein